MKSAHVIFLFLLIGLSACESLVTTIPDSKLPKTTSKLVVQSFISPQAARINVVVTESSPLFGETTSERKVIRNAIVKISSGTKEVVIPFDSVSKLYSIERTRFDIVPSGTYKLSVSDGQRSVDASCTVPANLATFKSYVIDTAYSGGSFGTDTSITLRMSWMDIPGEKNYYRVKAFMDLEYTIPEGNSAETFKRRRVRNRFNIFWDKTIGRNDLRTDANLDGTQFNSPLGRATLPGVLIFDYGNGNRFTTYPNSKIVMLVMEVYNTDESYYLYHRSLELSGNSDNPFVEPALIYTNINGGLGCFAAFNNKQLIYRP